MPSDDVRQSQAWTALGLFRQHHRAAPDIRDEKVTMQNRQCGRAAQAGDGSGNRMGWIGLRILNVEPRKLFLNCRYQLQRLHRFT
jgi:hypothetical protein